MSGEHERSGPFDGDNGWLLIPLAGISIPIIAIASSSALVWFLGVVIVVVAVTVGAHHLLLLRHRLRLEELAAHERLSLAERDRFAAIDRLVEPAPGPAASLGPDDSRLR